MAPKTNYRVNVVVNVKNKDHIDKLIKQLEKLRGTAAKDPMKPLRDSTKKTQIEMRKFGRVAQNVSFQLQDVIVQTSNGTSVFRSLGQQLPQMLVGFGAWGAAIGVVTALLPLMVENIGESEKAALDMSDALEGVSTATSALETAMGNFMAEGTQFQMLMVELSRLSGERKLADYLDELNEQLSASTWEVWARAGTTALDSILAKMRAMAAANFPILNAMAKIITGWSDVEVQFLGTGLTASKMAVELEKISELFGVNEQAAATVLKIKENYEASGKSVYDLRVYLRDLEDVLATAFAAGDTNAEGLLETIKALRTEMRALAGNSLLKEITAQGSKVDHLKPDRESGGRARDPFPQIVANAGNPEILAAYKAQQQALKDQQAAYAALYPEMTRYIKQVSDLNTLRDAGRLSAEQYTEGLKKAEEQLSGEPFSLAVKGVELFNSSFQTMLDGVVQGTQSISDGFKDMAKVIIAELLRIAAIKAIAGLFAPGSSIGTALNSSIGLANGGVVSNSKVTPFANGGVVSSPTMFPLANGAAGLMGEAGPEVVAPLVRRNGVMGVGASPVNVTVNNMASGVEVRTRQTDGGLTLDVVMAQVAGAVRQGGNDLTSAMESTYSIGRGGAAY